MTGWIAVLLFLGTFAQGNSAGPELLESTNRNRQTPLWVSLSKAVTSEGKLSPQYLDPYAVRDLQRGARDYDRHVATSDASPKAAPCFGERPAELASPSNTLAELAGNAHLIVAGKIVQRTLGFFEDRPGALLTVRVDEQLQHDGTYPSLPEYLVYYPDATFSVGSDTYCIRPATHPARPQVGDRILVFAYGQPIDPTGRLIYGQASKHLIFETAAGQVVPPLGLRNELAAARVTTLAQILRRIGKGDHRKSGPKVRQ
jgi:hypothetical protein